MEAVMLLSEAAAIDAAIREDIVQLRDVQTRLGHRLIQAEEHAARAGWGAFGTTSFSQFAESVGLSAAEGAQFRDAVRACAASPQLEAKVASGEVSIPKAAAVAPLVLRADLRRPGESVTALLEHRTTREVLDEVRQRKEEARVQEPTTPRTLFFTRKGLIDLDRVQDLVSRSARTRASSEQAVETALDDFLERHDPERKLARARAKTSDESPRVSPRATEPTRHVPAEEQRKVLERQGGDRCVVQGCDERAFLEFAHGARPFRLGGENTAANLLRACWTHHRQLDAGLWKPVPGRDGWVLVDVRGTCVGRLRAPT
jgi:hypothetical protein